MECASYFFKIFFNIILPIIFRSSSLHRIREVYDSFPGHKNDYRPWLRFIADSSSRQIFITTASFHTLCRWVRLCLWTAATNWPIVHPPDYIWVWRATVEWYWQEKTEELGEKPFPVPLCPSQFPHELTENTNRLSHYTTFPSTTFQVHHAQSSTIRHFVTSTMEKSSHKSALSFTWS
jgi:hypothetical protein